jgi:thiol-disulfide isomerase/thioredoxin|tara:strand:- start:281 stop:865 length:585 start_codon:yes stop_codon:yes gene_type:complete
MISLLISLLACGPAELKTTKSTDTESATVVVPEEFGVNEAPDCDQKSLGSNVCNIFLYDQFGSIWELYDHRGKVVVLNFSTSWCGPCQSAGMYSQGIYDHYKGEVEFATLLVDGFTHGLAPTEAEIANWVESHSITTVPILQASREYVVDPAGITGYLIAGFPIYIFLDKDLVIRDAKVGFNENIIKQTIDGLQ